ncbi:hypothetical protein PoB_003586800 [Plakobranchus ocellatus]|uniref:Uncharacterized protein n=1 Tax=Plakobranchus ocellatus TaxID=259542 RepID=A0AAV4ARC1_9GAST|nr:hypothetical protein PoB_003586800 [Plakobranchus ocellatus]
MLDCSSAGAVVADVPADNLGDADEDVAYVLADHCEAADVLAYNCGAADMLAHDCGATDILFDDSGAAGVLADDCRVTDVEVAEMAFDDSGSAGDGLSMTSEGVNVIRKKYAD